MKKINPYDFVLRKHDIIVRKTSEYYSTSIFHVVGEKNDTNHVYVDIYHYRGSILDAVYKNSMQYSRFLERDADGLDVYLYLLSRIDK